MNILSDKSRETTSTYSSFSYSNDNSEVSVVQDVDKTILHINSLMLAFIIASNFLSLVFAALGIISDGLIPIIFVSSLVVSYFVTFLKAPYYIRVNRWSFILVLFIFIAFFISFLFRGLESTGVDYFIQFLAYGFIVFLLTMIPYKAYYVIRYTMLIGLLFLTNPNIIINYLGSVYFSYDQMGMGTSYAILPIVVATIIHFSFFRDRKDFFIILAYITNFYLLVLMITEATRGAVLSIFFLIFFIFYIRVSKMQTIKRYLLPIMFISGLILSIFLIINLEKILSWIHFHLRNMGINIAIIEKTYLKIANDGFSGILNGRNLVYENALEFYSKSPIFGHGIGAYADVYGGVWPHNLFLHLLVEGGLFLMVPIGIVLYFCIRLLLKPWLIDSEFDEKRYLLLFAFIVSMPKLMFSSYLWMQQSFWLMIFVCLSIFANKQKLKGKNF